MESKLEPQFLTVSNTATALGISEQAVRSMLRSNGLSGRRLGRAWLVDASSVGEEARRRGRALPSSAVGRTTSNGGGAKHRSLRVLSFFSGAMGLDLGLEQAGLETLLTCEFDKWARRTIEANRPDLPLLGDIWQYTSTEIRQFAGLTASEEIDVIAGGPPCQAFSTAGQRRGFEDERGNVFLHYVDLCLELRPRYIVIENVRGLLSAPMKHRPHVLRGDGFPDLAADELPGGALRFVLHMLRAANYEVSFNLYNAANFGTPQTRERVIIVCSRDGSRVPHLSPTHSGDGFGDLPPWTTFREAVAGLPEAQHHLTFPEDRLRFYRMLGPGQYWKHLPAELQHEALGNAYFSGGGKTGFFRRLAWDKPSPTLVTHPAMPATDLAHPELDRPLSIEEYKRIQQFPDAWSIEGPLVQQYKQVGNAVPVGLGAALGHMLMAHAAGVAPTEPESFLYSRYRNTDERSWGVPTRVAATPRKRKIEQDRLF